MLVFVNSGSFNCVCINSRCNSVTLVSVEENICQIVVMTLKCPHTSRLCLKWTYKYLQTVLCNIPNVNIIIPSQLSYMLYNYTNHTGSHAHLCPLYSVITWLCWFSQVSLCMCSQSICKPLKCILGLWWPNTPTMFFSDVTFVTVVLCTPFWLGWSSDLHIVLVSSAWAICTTFSVNISTLLSFLWIMLHWCHLYLLWTVSACSLSLSLHWA